VPALYVRLRSAHLWHQEVEEKTRLLVDQRADQKKTPLTRHGGVADAAQKALAESGDRVTPGGGLRSVVGRSRLPEYVEK